MADHILDEMDSPRVILKADVAQQPQAPEPKKRPSVSSQPPFAVLADSRKNSEAGSELRLKPQLLTSPKTANQINFSSALKPAAANGPTEIHRMPAAGSMTQSKNLDDLMEKPSPFAQCLQTLLPCYFKKQDFFGEGLTLHHSLITTRRNFKPYNTMTEEEKKEKIQYLWH